MENSVILIHKRGALRDRKEDLDSDVIRLGRMPDITVVFPGHTVSGHHAEIRRRQDKYSITDLQSRNGTYVNGRRIDQADLHDGDRVELGEKGPQIEVQVASGNAATEPRIVPLSGNRGRHSGPISLHSGILTLGSGSRNHIDE